MKLIITFATLLILYVTLVLSEVRISSGTNASDNEFPFVVSIQYQANDNYQPTHLCAGTILNSKYVLTAAHCVGGIDMTKIVIVAGTANNNCYKDTTNRCSAVRRVKQIIVHPDYSVNTITNNLALIQVSQDFPLSTMATKVQNVPVEASSQNIPTSTTLQAIGWGSSASQLQKGEVTLQSATTCSTLGMTAPKQLCLKSKNVAICYSDAGGPIFYKRQSDGKNILTGVISFVGGCDIGQLSVSTNLSSYVDWIDNYVTDLQVNNYPGSGGNNDDDDCVCE